MQLYFNYLIVTSFYVYIYIYFTFNWILTVFFNNNYIR